MRVLDLYAGLCGWSDPWKERGHDVFSVDWDARFPVDLVADVLTLQASQLPWVPDVILASPPCEAFSVMTIGTNWQPPPTHTPKTAKAWAALGLVIAARRLIAELEPRWYVIENPRGKLRKLQPVADLECRTVAFCQYGEPFQKPTDLWGSFPPSLQLRPMCAPGASCHKAAIRGSVTGIQGTEQEAGTRKFRGGMVEDMRGVWSKSARRKELSALRAKIPRPLALSVCLAAEADW